MAIIYLVRIQEGLEFLQVRCLVNKIEIIKKKMPMVVFKRGQAKHQLGNLSGEWS